VYILNKLVNQEFAKKKRPCKTAGPLLEIMRVYYLKVAGQGLPALDLTFTTIKSL
jgi:hypothetical protein